MENLSSPLSPLSPLAIPPQSPRGNDPLDQSIVARVKASVKGLPVENVDQSKYQNISFIQILQLNADQQQKLQEIIDSGLREKNPKKAEEISCFQEALKEQATIIQDIIKLQFGLITPPA